MAYQSADDVGFVLLGAIMPLIGAVLDWITLTSAIDTVILSAMGALAAWGTKHTLDYIKNRLTAWWRNKRQVNNRLHTLMTLMVVSMLAVSCSTGRKVTEQSVSTATVRDSIVMVETVRVDTVRVAGETITRIIELECDEQGQVVPVAEQHRTGRASVSVSARGNALTVTANCDSLERLLVSRDTRISQLSETAESLLHTRDTQVRCDVPWPYKAAAWVAAGYLILTVLWVVWKLFRTYLKAQFPFLP